VEKNVKEITFPQPHKAKVTRDWECLKLMSRDRSEKVDIAGAHF